MSNRVQPVQPGDPRRVGPYRIVGRLGSGGMGTVYAALTATGERVAVKVVHPGQAADDEFRARFRREVQLSQRVTGPCLVPVRDADTQAATPWLVTPYVSGLTLGEHVTANGPLSGGRLYALATGTAAALAAVHAHGVIHRDVKPQNVILAPSGPQVLDFGIAHALDGTSVTRTGVMTGTPGWISPEHYRTGAVGFPGDVFAWGALLAYAATGRLPFGGGAADAVAFRIMQAEPDLDGIPNSLRPLVAKALSKDPSDRPSAAELAGECTELLAAQTTAVLTSGEQQPTLISDLVSAHWDLPPEAEPAWPTPPRRNNRTRLYLTVAVGAAVLGSLGGALAAASQSSNAAHGQAPHAEQPHERRHCHRRGAAVHVPDNQPCYGLPLHPSGVANAPTRQCPLPRLHPQRQRPAQRGRMGRSPTAGYLNREDCRTALDHGRRARAPGTAVHG